MASAGVPVTGSLLPTLLTTVEVRISLFRIGFQLQVIFFRCSVIEALDMCRCLQLLQGFCSGSLTLDVIVSVIRIGWDDLDLDGVF